MAAHRRRARGLPCADDRASATQPHARAARLQRGRAATRGARRAVRVPGPTRTRSRRGRPASELGAWDVLVVDDGSTDVDGRHRGGTPGGSRGGRRGRPAPAGAAHAARRQGGDRARRASWRRPVTWSCSPTPTWPRRLTSCPCSPPRWRTTTSRSAAGSSPTARIGAPASPCTGGCWARCSTPSPHLGHGPGPRLPVWLQGLPTRGRAGPVRPTAHHQHRVRCRGHPRRPTPWLLHGDRARAMGRQARLADARPADTGPPGAGGIWCASRSFTARSGPAARRPPWRPRPGTDAPVLRACLGDDRLIAGGSPYGVCPAVIHCGPSEHDHPSPMSRTDAHGPAPASTDPVRGHPATIVGPTARGERQPKPVLALDIPSCVVGGVWRDRPSRDTWCCCDPGHGRSWSRSCRSCGVTTSAAPDGEEIGHATPVHGGQLPRRLRDVLCAPADLPAVAGGGRLRPAGQSR